MSVDPAPSGLLGVLRFWLQGWSNDDRQPFEDMPMTCRGTPPHANAAVRVLVVDDNPVNLMLISAQMEVQGLQPSLAADGAQAVALACERPFDLILMDLQMPVLDGLAATAAIRRFEFDTSRAAVPVVAYSSLSPGELVLAMHGMNGRLSKPCEAQELEDCLARWCPGYRPDARERGAPHHHSGWQQASRPPVNSSVSLR